MFVGASALSIVTLWGFWVLMIIAFFQGELSLKTIGISVTLWIAGFVGLRFVLYGGLFLPYVAILDIFLVLAIFKGDVKLY